MIHRGRVSAPIPSVGALVPTLALSVVACLDPTQATVDITTNVACGPEGPASDSLFETGLVAGSDAVVKTGELQATTRACADPGGTVGSMVIYPRDGAEHASLLVIGAIGDMSAEQCLAVARGGSGDASSCVVARRGVAFAAHENLRLPVLLDRRCAGLICEEGQTCVFADGQPRCVSAEVTCTGTECEPSGAGGGGGVGAGGAGQGAAGAGGSGAGGAAAVFEELGAPPGLQGARAIGVSEDGAIVVGNAGATFPVVWRGGQSLVLASDTGVVADACGSGDVLVGTSLSPEVRARTWVWDSSVAGYVPGWVSGIVGSLGVDCSKDGNVIVNTSSSSLAGYVPPQSAPSLTMGGSSSAFAASGSLFVGANVGNPGAALCAVNATLTQVSCSLVGAAGDRALAVSADGSIAALVVAEHVEVRETGNVLAPPLHQGAATFVPRAIAGNPSAWIVVGTCDPVAPRACVIVDGQGPFDLEGSTGTPWPVTSGVDFGGVVPIEANDVSADGRVIVGTGVNAQAQEVAYRLAW